MPFAVNRRLLPYGGDMRPIPAGEFSAWLTNMLAAIAGDQDSDVPCGECTACCTSSQFVHIGPDEADTLAHIDPRLVFPAPGLPAGHVVMGYDERGHCPMLIEGVCSIYEHRPRTCRTYDCRVFPASGIEPDDKPLIADRVRRWEFEYANSDARSLHEAVRAAARSVRERETTTSSATQLAVLALETVRVELTDRTRSGST
jgi:Fe-S-cluster containining protein